MGYPRSDLVVPGAAGTFPCVSRCVRRVFLCGEVALTGRRFDRRKAWLGARLLALAEVLSISVLACAVMGNHVQVIVNVSPSIAAASSDVKRPSGGRRPNPTPRANAFMQNAVDWLNSMGC